MQSHYLDSFTREMGCTSSEWHGWLPQAMGASEWRVEGEASGVVHATFATLFPQSAGASLRIDWEPMEPRRIALITMPRMKVSFRFTGLSDAQRYQFMKRFDLYMQRGGG